jgi:excisionase family DNA binding protein
MKDTYLLTINEAAKLLSVSRSTVYRLIWRNELPTVKIGAKAVRIPRAAVEAIARTPNPSDLRPEIIADAGNLQLIEPYEGKMYIALGRHLTVADWPTLGPDCVSSGELKYLVKYLRRQITSLGRKGAAYFKAKAREHALRRKAWLAAKQQKANDAPQCGAATTLSSNEDPKKGRPVRSVGNVHPLAEG